MSIFDIGLLNTSYTAADALSLGDPIDQYRFTVGDSSSWKSAKHQIVPSVRPIA